jgi:hypothetical protein
MISETDKAYVAGFIDGEGCISISRREYIKRTPTPIYTLTVAVVSTNRDVLEYCRNLTNLGAVMLGGLPRKDSHHQEFSWRISSRQAIDLLQLILPYLRIKREQADIAIAFQETFGKSPMGGRGLGLKVLPEILQQREQYRQAITDAKGYTVIMGRPPSKSTQLPEAE